MNSVYLHKMKLDYHLHHQLQQQLKLLIQKELHHHKLFVHCAMQIVFKIIMHSSHVKLLVFQNQQLHGIKEHVKLQMEHVIIFMLMAIHTICQLMMYLEKMPMNISVVLVTKLVLNQHVQNWLS